MSFMKNLFKSDEQADNTEHLTISITADNYAQEVENSDVPVLVDFWAPWCAPCRIVGPIVEELAKEYEGKVKVGKFNTDENPQFVSRFGIRGIPTLIFFKGGKEADRIIGAAPKNQIAAKLDALL